MMRNRAPFVNIHCPGLPSAGEPFRLICAGEVEASPGEEYVRRKHQFCTIECVVAGKGTVSINGQDGRLEQGDSYLLPPGSTHRYAADLVHPWRKVFIDVSGPLVDELLRAYGLVDRWLYPGLSLTDALREFMQIVVADPVGAHTTAALRFHALLIEMSRHARQATATTPPLVVRAQAFIDRNLESRIAMRDIARHAHASVAHTTRVFKKHLGLTPTAYLIEQRMSTARALLCNTNLPIKAIARRLRYADEYYFSNAFKSRNGVSPSRYREATRSAERVTRRRISS